MNEITLPMMRQTLYSAVVADALDALGRRNQSPRVSLAPMTVDGVLIGRCKTTLWEDVMTTQSNPYELELRAVDECQTDQVLVAAGAGSQISGVWGELLTTAARNAGCVGAVIDGAVRDVRKMRQMAFPVYARGKSVYDSANRQRVVDLDLAVQIAGVEINPGDLIVSDEDGVVVVPQAVEEEAIRHAWDKVHAENETRDAIAAGMKAGAAYAKYGVL